MASIKLMEGMISIPIPSSWAYLSTNPTLIAISIGGLVYVFGILGFGGITQEEILAMPKGNKLLAKLKKYRLIRG